MKERINRFNGSPRPVIICGKGKTEQSHKKECDLNYILKNYQKTGFIAHANKNAGRYDDISPLDFQDAMFKVAQANTMFEELPSSVRNRFKNNPGAFLEFVQNPDNRSQMEKMGILKGNDGIDIKGAKTMAPVEAVEAIAAAIASAAKTGADKPSGASVEPQA